MKQIGISLLLIALVTAPAAAQPAKTPAVEPPPKTLKDQASYGIGYSIGQNLKANDLDVSPAVLARGLVDALTGTKPALTQAEIQAAIEAFEKQMDELRKQAGGKSKTEGEAFLAANAKKEGVKSLPSGLQYKVLKAGTGASPKATDTVKAHYHGTFISGKVFDSSVERGEPIEIPVNGVIAGWTEALQLMKVGDKWQLFIPANLAYGEPGRGAIPPNTALVFEVELLDIIQ